MRIVSNSFVLALRLFCYLRSSFLLFKRGKIARRLCRDGRSRCFGFVGFATEEQAAAAVSYFHRTYMDASRLEVEFAQKYGSKLASTNAWSKYTPGTSGHKKLQAKIDDDKAEHREDSSKTSKRTKKKSDNPEESAFTIWIE